MKRRLVFALLVSMIATLAACGGDSEPTGSSTPTGSTTPTAGPPSLFSTEECRSVALALAAAASGGFGTGQQSPDDAVIALQRLASTAPAEIKLDIELVGREIQKFYEALRTAGADFNNPSTFSNPQTAQAAGQAAAAFQASGAPAAVDRMESYFDQICPGAG